MNIMNKNDFLPQTKEDIQKNWIDAGKPCTYRHGFAYRGAEAKKISKEKATELLPKYEFGMGFYTLDYRTVDGEQVLEFNELSECDMY